MSESTGSQDSQLQVLTPRQSNQGSKSSLSRNGDLESRTVPTFSAGEIRTNKNGGHMAQKEEKKCDAMNGGKNGRAR